MTMKICTEFRGFSFFTREIQRERERERSLPAPAIIRLKSLDTMIVVEDPAVRDREISDESERAPFHPSILS